MIKRLTAVAAGLLLAASAQAAVVVQSFPQVLDTTEIAQVFSFNLFDSSLGDLTGVSFNVDGRAISEVSILNTAAQAQDFLFNSNIRLRLSGPLLANSDLNLALFAFDDTIPENGTVNLGPVDVDAAAAFAGVVASFTGPGTSSVTCRSLVSNTQAGGGGNLTVDQTTTAGCGLEIVYTYDERQDVPEPGSMALVGLALAGLGLVRRRKA